MKIIPLAFDSMGTRSMATFVETKDVKALIDPGVALAPARYGLPPHPIEIRRMEEQWAEIKKRATQADILIVTHYHYDHHDPEDTSIYKGKTVFLKNPVENINMSQAKRSKYFLEKLEGLPREIIYSDGKEYTRGKTRIKFSAPMSHGLNDRLGYVTEVLIEDIGAGKRFIHTSDVLGPSTREQAEFIIREKPDILYTDGPMYFSVSPAIENLKRIIEECSIEKLVIDHHLLRDANWRAKIGEVFRVAEEKGGTKVMTAAEFAGKENDLLEAKRKELYRMEPQSG